MHASKHKQALCNTSTLRPYWQPFHAKHAAFNSSRFTSLGVPASNCAAAAAPGNTHVDNAIKSQPFGAQ
jgi:hypothetical protein